MLRSTLALLLTFLPLTAEDSRIHHLKARASEIDLRTREHPEIDFTFGSRAKPQDLQHAIVNTGAAPRGRLVIWLMAHNSQLLERTASYGLHSIQIHYARGWFSKLYPGKTPPADDLFLSKVRLEAATGRDFSQAIEIPAADGMMERAYQFVQWLQRNNPEGNWKQFLSAGRDGLDWDKVIVAGASHGATTAARFAKYQKVARVVMFCGPRDQFESWQSLPSATPAERFFAFSHVLDGGWTGDHYPRSWQMLGLQSFGPLVDIDNTPPPYRNSRRLITRADVGNNPGRAHGSVTPGKTSPKNGQDDYLFEDAWRYLFTHATDQVGNPVPPDPSVKMNQRDQSRTEKQTLPKPR